MWSDLEGGSEQLSKQDFTKDRSERKGTGFCKRDLFSHVQKAKIDEGIWKAIGKHHFQ